MKYLILFLVFNNTYSEDLFKRINKNRESIYQKNLKKYHDKRQHNSYQREALKVQKEDILKSKVIMVAIKENSRLIEIETGEVFTNPKEIISKAFSLTDFEGFRYLISKDKKIRYKIYETDTTDTKSILKMYETPNKFKAVKRKIDYGLKDQNFGFHYNLTLDLGFASSSFIQDITETKKHSSNFLGSGLSMIGQWEFPIKSGLGIDYQFISATNSGIDYQLNSFLTSLILELPKAKFFFLENINYQLKFSKQLSSRLKVDEKKTFNISQNALQIGVTRPVFSLFRGQILMGLSFQRQWMKAKSNKELFSIDSTNKVNDIVSFNISFRGVSLW